MVISRNAVRIVAALVVAVSICTSLARGDVTIDLTGGTGSDGYANDAYFLWVDENSTGTGVIDSFLRIQANGTERGYNTDGALEFDTKSSHTKALLLSSVPQVTIADTLYREFLLDIGESSSGSSPLLSLDTLEIYLAGTGDLTGYDALGTLIFDLDSGSDGDATVVMDASLNPGNGWGDVFVYVPDDLFSGGDYVYLYSEFGGLYPSDSGPEEWAVRLTDPVVIVPVDPPPIVPVPAAFLLVLTGGSAVISMHRRRKS